MGLKNDVELQLINFQKAYNSLDTSAEDYDAQLVNLQNEYNLNLDANQMSNSEGIDPLSLDDIDSVRKRMLLNAKRDRKYARQEKWKNAGNNIVSTAIGHVGNIIRLYRAQTQILYQILLYLRKQQKIMLKMRPLLLRNRKLGQNRQHLHKNFYLVTSINKLYQAKGLNPENHNLLNKE